MKIGFFGGNFLIPIIKSLERLSNFSISYYNFSKDLDILITGSHFYMYDVLKYMKKIKDNNIKLVNIILDIPPWRLEQNYFLNTPLRLLKQYAYDLYYKFKYKMDIANLMNRSDYLSNILSSIEKRVLGQYLKNRIFYQYNYRTFLKKSDLNLSISFYTKKLVEKFLKIKSKVWYPGVNSDILEDIPKNLEKKYDAINISRIARNKRQEIFVKAANRLNLKILVIGRYNDKSIHLNCSHRHIPDHKKVFKILSQSHFYVDPSEFEGFGLTAVEAAFLEKPVIASDTFVHREILGNFPLYFKTNDVDDLTKKMKMVIEGTYCPDKNEIKRIKKLYNIDAAMKRLKVFLEDLLP